MFAGSNASMLDLSSFNTSKVTNMYGMFYDSKATTINLSSFDTSQVTDMRYMFALSEVRIIDLSSFNISSVEVDLTGAFENSQATLGYARNDIEKQILNYQKNIFRVK